MERLTIDQYKDKFSEMMFYYEDIHKVFNRNVYSEKFGEFYEAHRPLFFSFEEYYDSLAEEEKESTLSAIAQEFVNKSELKNGGLSKRKKEVQTFELNLCLVVLVDPALLEFRSESTEKLADKLVSTWNEHYPKQQIGLTDFGSINGGFRKKFCYITTATCRALNKGDDCYELNAFRNYRDSYLAMIPDGRKWIDEYYDLAPSIIKGIEKEGRQDEVYTYVFDEYLRPCLGYIEHGNNERCRQKYEEMVNELAQRYVYE